MIKESAMSNKEFQPSEAYLKGWDVAIGKTVDDYLNPYEYGTVAFREFVCGFGAGKKWLAKESAELCEMFGIK